LYLADITAPSLGGVVAGIVSQPKSMGRTFFSVVSDLRCRNEGGLAGVGYFLAGKYLLADTDLPLILKIFFTWNAT
jgi:hypothetical protein